jgi:predicted unusual protein kinase regulating ubiquinone biosynthesis (AarF/ABC1/UbiB family)
VDRLVQHLGGIPVKFAQIAGARGDLFPEPWVRRMRRYHDAVPPRPLADLRPVLEHDLARPLDEVFAEIEEPALAAASIAQVHGARLRSGERVVLKIQYPEIGRIAPVDLATGRAVSRLVSRLSGSDFRTFVREMTRFVGLELDFAREADSTERVARALEGTGLARVPAVHRAWCGPRLLVLERLDGIPITDVDALRAAGHDPGELAGRVARLYATMIFEHGFFHGDPHPGNLLVLPDGTLGLLDFGLCKELPPGFGRKAAALVAAATSGDAPATLRAADALGFDVRRVDPEAGLALVGMLLGRERPDGAPVLPRLLRRNPLATIPEDVALVVRTLVLLVGLSHALAPGEHRVQQELARAVVPLLRAPEPPLARAATPA